MVLFMIRNLAEASAMKGTSYKQRRKIPEEKSMNNNHKIIPLSVKLK